MRNVTLDLEQFLDELALAAQPGDRLPTIRALMHRFGTSQVVVQRAFQQLKARGVIASEVGRGTYFVADGGRPAGLRQGSGETPAPRSRVRPATVKSVLLLRRAISLVRGRMLVEGLQRRWAVDGHRVLELSYNDADHARTVLKGLPRFDACVIQSSFKTIPIELLAALRERSDVLAVDGMALIGADVEAVGMEWGEPLAVAISHLQQLGHRRIAYASTSLPFLPTQLGLRRFEHLQRTLTDVELSAVTVPHLPDDENYITTLVKMITSQRDSAGQLPFSALIAWGIEDGHRFRELLANLGLEIPSSLSVVLLGRTDLVNEHANFFSIVGCSLADQVEGLYQAVNDRWIQPTIPYGMRWIPVSCREGASMGPVQRPGGGVAVAAKSSCRKEKGHAALSMARS